MALSTTDFLTVKPISSSPSTAPVFTVHRVVKGAADSGDITVRGVGMNMAGYRSGAIRVVPSVSANPNIEIQFWSEAAGKFISAVPAITANGIGAGKGYSLSFKAFGGVALVKVTGGIAGGDTVTILIAGSQRVPAVEAALPGFKTEWTVAGDAAARTITLPLVQNRAEGALAYNCVVDWGDGTTPSVVTSYNDANRIHTYVGDGTYEVEITGTMEGWSFNNAGDKLKITDIINWGDLSVFDGFKYLKGGSYGCALASLGSGSIIPASGTGILTDGFHATFRDCTLPTSIPSGLFDNHAAVSTSGFELTFAGWTSGTTIPSGLFDVHTALSTRAFASTFRGWSGAIIPSGLFDHNTLVSSGAFEYTFWGSGVTSIPPGLFDYCTLVSSGGFYGTFRDNPDLETAPPNLFRNNTLVSANGYAYTFQWCNKMQQSSDIFYAAGEQLTRFVAGPDQSFSHCFDRAAFTGVQGTAPDLWECDFGEVMTIDVSPATDWDPGDIITGQTSGATCVVRSKTDATHYKVYKHLGTFQLGEIIGVTGVANKLADQGAAHPTFAGGPIITDCWNGAGNSGTSLDNYGDIPADWI